MTTLAFDGTILACDSLRSADGMRIIADGGPKFRLVRGHIVAIAGEVVWGERFVRWYRTQRRSLRTYPKALTEIDACAAVYDGKHWWQYFPDYEHREALEAHWALGSGKVIAQTALELGHTAIEAVKVACKLDVYSGGTMYSAHLQHYIDSKGKSVDAFQ